MKIVIVGAGEVGSHLAKMLRNSSNDVTVIDNDGERLQRVTSIADVGAVNGSPTSIEVLRSADPSSVRSPAICSPVFQSNTSPSAFSTTTAPIFSSPICAA